MLIYQIEPLFTRLNEGNSNTTPVRFFKLLKRIGKRKPRNPHIAGLSQHLVRDAGIDPNGAIDPRRNRTLFNIHHPRL
jgi:hypothetical protein